MFFFLGGGAVQLELGDTRVDTKPAPSGDMKRNCTRLSPAFCQSAKIPFLVVHPTNRKWVITPEMYMG